MIAFSLVPSDVKQPGFYGEVDSSKAQTGTTSRPTLLMGQMLASATATVHVPVRVSSAAQADALFGVGSHLARMVRSYVKGDPYAEIWAIPVADGGGSKAAGVITITGTSATAAGTLHLLIAGQRVEVPVAVGGTPTTVGAAIAALLGVDEAAAVTAASQSPVTCVNTAGALALTARHAGLLGNLIDLRANYLGAAGGQVTPAGLKIAITTPMASGTTPPTLTAAIAAMQDKRYSFVAMPWADATSLDAFQAEFADSVAGRWGPMRPVYGHVYSADVNTYTVLSTTGLATAKNQDAHCSILGIESSPTPPWEIAAAYCARAAQSLRIDPARPLNTLELIGVLPPAEADRFLWAEREVLLGLGITTPLITTDGKVLIQRATTNKVQNALGSTDLAYFDVTTPATLDVMLTELAEMYASKFARVKLVSDMSQVGAGQVVVDPSYVRAAQIARYRQWVRRGIAENAEVFAKLLVVERNETDPNRLDTIFPPDLVNALHILAALAEFRLQYSEGDLAAAG